MNTIKFLGTAGARVVVALQTRASGGIWLSFDGTDIHLDPGPGALVRALLSKPKLQPSSLSAIILSHKHLDHSNDINIIIEAMTNSGLKKRGKLFITEDALENDIPLKYTREFVEEIIILKEKQNYNINNINFSSSIKHIHQNTETYGFKFFLKDKIVSFITDTRFFPELIDEYKADVIVANVVFDERKDYDHLCLCDAKKLIEGIKPKRAILTHFGMTLISLKPWLLAQKLTDETGIKVIAASDGMTINLDEI